MFKRRLRRLETLVKQVENAAQAPAPRPLQSAQDVMDLLQEQVDALRAARWCGVLPKARTLGYLAGIARKAIESKLLAERLESRKQSRSRSGVGPSSPPSKVYMGFDPNAVVKPTETNVPFIDPSALAGFLADKEALAKRLAGSTSPNPNDTKS